MKILSSLILCIALITNIHGKDVPRNPEKPKLSNGVYKIGMTRVSAEKELGGAIIAEFNRDHGFAPLRDVYYELNSSWIVVIAYSPAGLPADASEDDRRTMKLVVQPLLLTRTPDLMDWINQQKSRLIRIPN